MKSDQRVEREGERESSVKVVTENLVSSLCSLHGPIPFELRLSRNVLIFVTCFIKNEKKVYILVDTLQYDKYVL